MTTLQNSYRVMKRRVCENGYEHQRVNSKSEIREVFVFFRKRPVPRFDFPVSTVWSTKKWQGKMSRSNPSIFDIDQDIDYSKLSPMLGLVDNEQPDYVDQGVNMRATTSNSHNVAVVYISGSSLCDFRNS